MTKKIISRTLYCLLILLGACRGSQDKSPADTAEKPPFFNVKAYFTAEAGKRAEQNRPVLKRVRIDGRSEEKMVSDIDFEKEFQVFIRSDINRSAWFDKYAVDSLFEGGGLRAITYTSTDPDLKMQWMRIDFDTAGTPQEILIRNQTSSSLAETAQELRYKAGHGYSIESRQKVLTGKEHRVAVDVSFQ